MLDIVYSLLLIALIAFWALYHRPGRERIVGVLQRNRRLLLIALWSLFLSLLVFFASFYGYMADSHDIDNAVEAAAEHLSDGGNPYTDTVVPRFPDVYYSSPRPLVNGTYNYLPLDLFAYTAMWKVLSFLGTPHWFVLANAIFSVLATIMFWYSTRIDPKILVPVAGSIFIFFSFDNVCLTAALVVAGILFLKRGMGVYDGLLLALLFFGLASLTKTYAVVVLIVFLIMLLQVGIAKRNLRALSLILATGAALIGLAIAISIPFGFGAVLDSTVFFHTDPDLRINASVGGTPLYQILGDSDLYFPISVSLMFAALLLTLRFRSLMGRIMIAEVVFLAVLLKSTHSAPLIPAIFLFLAYISERLSWDDISLMIRAGDRPGFRENEAKKVTDSLPLTESEY